MSLPTDPAKEEYQRGVVALERRWYSQAAAHFRSAMGQEKKSGEARNLHMKYASFLGVALTMEGGHGKEGLILCEEAVKSDFLDPDVHCNLGIILIRLRDRKRAFEAFASALEIRPRHPRTMEQLKLHERRRRPVFKNLHRNHRLNRIFGRIRQQLGFLFEKPPPKESADPKRGRAVARRGLRG